MDVSRSVFGISEPRHIYAVGMVVSLVIHIALGLAIVTLPKLVPSKKFSDIKVYRVKVVSADQIGKLPQIGIKAPSASEIFAKSGSKEPGESRGSIPVYSARKISVPIEDSLPQKSELRPIESPPSMPLPKPAQQPSAKWETLVPNISVKRDIKPIEQRKEFLKEATSGQREVDSDKSLNKTQQGTGAQRTTEGLRGQQREQQSGLVGGGPYQSSEEYGLARRLYYSEVWRAIQSQWAVPVELLNRDDLEAIVIIKISRDGNIMDMRFEKKSGNEIFDSSVLRAIQKANPLPPFPKSYSPPYEEIGIRFRPKDLKKG
ncbi:MAG: TonB family protein [Syntrophobacterales bacterium]|nr:TonB family protein [Syntrophobacterales bacterium]